MKAEELKTKYLEFFKSKGHAIIKSAPLIPENDPTVLFTTAGMHPLVPYLLGQPHPLGKRLADVQKCFRTTDIEDVGDNTHLTFFEMLGNWSLGDYFKKEAISWSHEFLTKVLKINPEKLNVTVFAGDKDAPKDIEAFEIWNNLGLSKERIFFLPRENNWWGPAGETGPCGPCSEMFIDTGKEKCGSKCVPGCHCGKYVEIWNDVFMEYNKTKQGKYEKLKQKNVDTGMGVERALLMLNNLKSVYEIDFFIPLFDIIKKSSKSYNEKSARIVVDHIRAATFILGDEKSIVPSNVDQGYILRRLIRRAIRHSKLLGLENKFLQKLSLEVIKTFSKDYPTLNEKKEFILKELNLEEERFLATLERGLKAFEDLTKQKKELSSQDSFLLFQSFGFPIEMTNELALEKGIKVNIKDFKKEYEKHKELSRTGAEKKFKGGLADASEATTKLHTATHLLNAALREVLKDSNINQRGSNITPERLRFDFNFPRKLEQDEIKKVEALVNEKIKEGIEVKKQEMVLEQAKKQGFTGVFDEKYSEKVFVYSIGNFSREICGGPHVKNTKELGKFKIIKEEGISAGTRRIKAVLE